MNYSPQMTARESPRKAKIGKQSELYHRDAMNPQWKHWLAHKYPKSILDYPNANRTEKQHPTQKPVTLMSYLIRTYTNEGDTVLDFTMGSGSTGIAALKTGRNFIGMELRGDYFAIAERRIAAAQLQMPLDLAYPAR